MIILLRHSMDAQSYFTEIEMGQSVGNTAPVGEMSFEDATEWKIFNDVFRAGIKETGAV